MKAPDLVERLALERLDGFGEDQKRNRPRDPDDRSGAREPVGELLDRLGAQSQAGVDLLRATIADQVREQN